MKSGKTMPCEVESVSWDEVEEGDTLISEDGETLKSFGDLKDDSRLFYQPHWGNCSGADNFRNKKGN